MKKDCKASHRGDHLNQEKCFQREKKLGSLYQRLGRGKLTERDDDIGNTLRSVV